jgi:hypothetical protein
MSKAVMMLATLTAAAGVGCGGAVRCDPIAHIVAVDFGRTADALWWTLEVEDIPDLVTFNQISVPPDYLEYRWAVDIDSDRSGQPDLSVAVSHFVRFGAMRVMTPDILSVAQADLWAVNGAVSSTIGDITATITDNTFRFEVAANEAPGLAVVSDRRQSTWTTSYRFGGEPGDQCEEMVR